MVAPWHAHGAPLATCGYLLRVTTPCHTATTKSARPLKPAPLVLLTATMSAKLPPALIAATMVARWPCGLPLVPHVVGWPVGVTLPLGYLALNALTKLPAHCGTVVLLTHALLPPGNVQLPAW